MKQEYQTPIFKNLDSMVNDLSSFVQKLSSDKIIDVDGIDLDYEWSASLYLSPTPSFDGRNFLVEFCKAIKQNSYLGQKLLSHAPQIDYFVQLDGGSCNQTDVITWNLDGNHTAYTSFILPNAHQYIDYVFIQFYNNPQACDQNKYIRLQVQQLSNIKNVFTSTGLKTKIIFGKCNQGCDIEAYSLANVGNIKTFFQTVYHGETLESLIDGFMLWCIDTDFTNSEYVAQKVNKYLNPLPHPHHTQSNKITTHRFDFFDWHISELCFVYCSYDYDSISCHPKRKKTFITTIKILSLRDR